MIIYGFREPQDKISKLIFFFQTFVLKPQGFVSLISYYMFLCSQSIFL
jgi:hypothetical protein